MGRCPAAAQAVDTRRQTTPHFPSTPTRRRCTSRRRCPAPTLPLSLTAPRCRAWGACARCRSAALQVGDGWVGRAAGLAGRCPPGLPSYMHACSRSPPLPAADFQLGSLPASLRRLRLLYDGQSRTLSVPSLPPHARCIPHESSPPACPGPLEPGSRSLPARAGAHLHPHGHVAATAPLAPAPLAPAPPRPARSLERLRVEKPGALGVCLDDLWGQVEALELRSNELLLGVPVEGERWCWCSAGGCASLCPPSQAQACPCFPKESLPRGCLCGDRVPA